MLKGATCGIRRAGSRVVACGLCSLENWIVRKAGGVVGGWLNTGSRHCSGADNGTLKMRC